VSTSGKGRLTANSKKKRKTSIKVTVLIGLFLKNGFSGSQSVETIRKSIKDKTDSFRKHFLKGKESFPGLFKRWITLSTNN